MRTLLAAVALVAIVVLIFLQSWRSAIIPLVAVPVAVIGTFAVMAAIGFSLNNLTLFGLVLAIGIVVDDAIVVVEAVEHHIEQGLAPRDATIKAMSEVSGPVIAVASGADGRVHALHVYLRHHRLVFPAIRGDGVGVDGHLGVQFAHAEPGAGGDLIEAHPCEKRHSRAGVGFQLRVVLSRIQLELSPCHERLSAHCRDDAARQSDRAGAVRRAVVFNAVGHEPTADRLFAPSRQRLPVHFRPVARRGVARTNPKSRGADRRDRAQRSGGGRHAHARRAIVLLGRDRPERGTVLHYFEGF